MKISEESFTLMLKFLIAGHMKKLPAIRRKIEKQALEDASLLCALVLALVREVKESYPVPDAALQDFIDTFVSGGDFDWGSGRHPLYDVADTSCVIGGVA